MTTAVKATRGDRQRARLLVGRPLGRGLLLGALASAPLLVMAVLAPSVAAQQALAPQEAEVGCINDWSVAAPIVRKEGLASISEVLERARGQVEGSVVRTMLCRAEGGYAYRLVVRSMTGQLRQLMVDARHPFAR